MELTNPPKNYKVYGSVYASCQYHVLFCTKYRRKVLTEDIANHLGQLIIDGQKEGGYTLISHDVAIDHVHLVLAIPPTTNIYSVVTHIKGLTSHTLRETYRILRSRIPTLWTRACMISTLGSVDLSNMETFLEEQKKR